MTNEVLLGIDPGRSKTGLALTDGVGKILKLCIVHTESFMQELEKFLQGIKPCRIVIGNGTNSKAVLSMTRQALADVQACVIQEAHSTEDARLLYWEVNPPQGLKKILPLGLLVPSEPLDAYAAVVLIRRYLKTEN